MSSEADRRAVPAAFPQRTTQPCPVRRFRGAGRRGYNRDFFYTPTPFTQKHKSPRQHHAALFTAPPGRRSYILCHSGNKHQLMDHNILIRILAGTSCRSPWPAGTGSCSFPVQPGHMCIFHPLPPAPDPCRSTHPRPDAWILPPIFTHFPHPAPAARIKEKLRKPYSSGAFSWSKWRDSNPRPFGPEPLTKYAGTKTQDIYIFFCNYCNNCNREKSFLLYAIFATCYSYNYFSVTNNYLL